MKIEEWKRIAEGATPGEWDWYARRRDSKHFSFMLAAPHGGTTVVMDFCRVGMQGAEPRFARCDDGLPRGKRGGILYPANELMADGKLDHPDAAHIAASHPARVIAALKVIEAAKKMRAAESIGDQCVYDDAFDAALAALEALP